MTDRERAWGALDNLRNWETRPDLRELLADAMLEFAANEVETCVGDPTFRAEELRAQVGGRQ